MAVIISNDFKIPQRCSNCVLEKAYGLGVFWCALTGSYTRFKDRNDNCPLKGVPTGKWIINTDLGYYVSVCSECGHRFHGDTHLIYKPKYCANCGSRNDVVEKQQGEQGCKEQAIES